jgi:hypothetical protein
MEASLNAATAKLNTAHQTLAKEKSAAEQLRRKLATVIKDLEKSRTELAIANQTIRNLKSTHPTAEKPSLNTAEPAQKPQTDSSAKSVVPREPGPQGAISPTAPSSPQPVPAQPPVTAVPAPSMVPAPNPGNQVDPKTSPATESTVSKNRPVADEKTTADLPEAPPAAPTTADD